MLHVLTATRVDRSGERVMRVLIVDDEADVRLMARAFLRRHGWTIEEAADGTEALQLCRSNPPDVVVLDYRMPGLTGLEVARSLMDEGFGRPMVLFSAYLTPEVEDDARTLGIRTMSKTDYEDLADVIRELAA